MARAAVSRNRILVPLDGSPLADAMVRRLGVLLNRTGAEVSLLSVARTSDGVAEARRHLAATRFALERQAVRVSAHVRRGDAAEQILATAKREQPWCIAMATHGRSGAARWALGSVTERVLREADRPVLIANPAALRSPLTPKRILVPLDGSDVSASVLPHARILAKAFGARLTLVHFVERDAQRRVREVPPKRSLGGYLSAEVDRLEAAGLGADLRITSGPAAKRLLEIAKSDGSDLIAMTTHGRSGLARWAYGSVAETVVRHAACPLFVHRPTQAARRSRAGGAAPSLAGARFAGVAGG